MTVYASTNFQTKKALKEAIANGVVVSANGVGITTAPRNGRAYISGPWYPKPHKWYAEVDVIDGRIVRVK